MLAHMIICRGSEMLYITVCPA